MTDKLSGDIISSLVNEFDITVKYEKEVTSTNILAKQYANNGADEGLVVLADSQTAGRGRFDRKFFSPKNCGIYMSIVLKPTLQAENSVLITAAAAVAVAKACEELSHQTTQIKWVNDVYINKKKVCGILTEGSIKPDTQGFNWAVVGIGINAYTPENDFEKEIENIAGAVFKKKEENLRNRLCALSLNYFFKYYKELESKSFIDEYRQRLMGINQKITVHKLSETLPATVIGINDNCRLLVEYQDKTQEYLSSGEISIKLV